MAHVCLQGSLAHDALGSGSTTLSVGYAAHTNAAGTAVSAAPAAYKAAAASTSAQKGRRSCHLRSRLRHRDGYKRGRRGNHRD